jgi:hypothetical protein
MTNREPLPRDIPAAIAVLRADGELWEALQTDIACMGWRQIDTAPRDREALFWVVPKPPEDTYVDSAGHPIVVTFTPYLFKGHYGSWSSLSKATHWMPLPTSPICDH